MATVPGILHIAAYQGQGSQPPLQVGDPVLALGAFNDPDLNNYVPGGVSEMGSPVFFPWYDGSAALGGTTYNSTGNTSTTMTATPSPGWTPGAFVGRQLTKFKFYLGIPGLPLVPDGVFLITANTANTVTVSTSMGSAPANGTVFRIGTGRFIVYQHAPGTTSFAPGLVTDGLGGAWAQGGNGAGLDVTALRQCLLDVYRDPPYFHWFKFVTTAGIEGGWKAGGNSRNLFAAELVRVTAAAAERGNTIEWRHCIVDLSQEDMREAGLSLVNYKANLLDLMDWLMTTLSAPGMLFQLISPPTWQLAGTKPGASWLVRELHDQIAIERPRVAIVDMNGEQPGAPIQIVSDPAPDTQFLTTNGYLRQGKQVVATMRRQLLGLPTSGLTGRGVPIFGLVGDSIAAGQVEASWVVSLASPTVTGSTPGSTARGMVQRVYNRVAGQLQPYDPAANANRSGDVNLKSGLELAIMDELAQLFPDGFIMVKRGASSSALTSTIAAYSGGQGGRWIKSANQHYPEFVADVRAAEALAWSEGLVPEFSGLFVSLGTNDGILMGDGAKFAAAVKLWVRDLRADLTTRPVAKKSVFPIAWRLPQFGVTGRRPDEVAAIRAAIPATGEPGVFVVNVDGTELRRDDGIHETPASTVATGRAMVRAIAAPALL